MLEIFLHTRITDWLCLLWIDLSFECDAGQVSQVALVGKNLPANPGDIRDAGSIPGLGKSPGGGHGNPLQDFCLENYMDRGT